jgi:hypothetical protein
MINKLMNSLSKQNMPNVGTEATPSERIKATGITMDYSDIGVTPYGIDMESLGARQSEKVMALKQDWRIERNANLPPVSISRGTVSTEFGGITQFLDEHGGTLLIYDPVTGTISIYGGLLVNETVNLGTIYNSQMSGTIVNTGTFYMGAGTAGTLSNTNLVGGTLTGFWGTTGTLGDTIFNGGTIGTPNILGGIIAGANFNTGTLNSPKVAGVSVYETNAGSARLMSNGAMAVQTYGTGVIIALRLGGTTFRFTPSGTI